MPRKEDIERFKDVLNSLGSEPEIRAQKAEAIEDVAPPEEGLPSDINELLGSFGGSMESLPSDGEQEAAPEEEQETAPGEEQAAAPDEEQAFAPDEEAALAGLEGEPSAEQPASPGAEVEGLDFESLFGEQGGVPSIEELERAPRRRQRGEKRRKGEKPGREAQPEEEPAPAEAAPPEETPETEETFSLDSSFSLEEPSAELPQPTDEQAAGNELAAGDELVAGDEPGPTFELTPPTEPTLEQSFEPSPEAGLEPGADLQTDIDQMEVLAEEGAETPASAEAPAGQEAGTEEVRFDGIELPSFDEMQQQEAPPSRAAPPPPPPEPSFALPTEGEVDMGDLQGLEGEDLAGGASPATEERLAEEEQLGDLDLGEFDIPETQPPGAGPAGSARGGPSPRQAQRAGQRGAPQKPGARPALPRGAAPRAGRVDGVRPGLRGAAARVIARAAPAAARFAPGLAAGARRAAEIEELEAADAGPVELTPAEFERLKKALDSLPRNLKIAVEDIVAGGKGTGGQLAALIRLLVQGASAVDIAALAGRITGKKIRVPAGYEKKTGAAHEAERRTFGYAFRENIFPVLRLFLASALAVGLVAFFGYRFVYRPLYAYSNYSRGLTHITAERYSLANERFSRAVGVWPRRNWFYRYADAFAARRQFLLAEEKYEQLLRRYPGDRKGILDYARLESKSLSNYEKAETLLGGLLDENLYDYDALLASGDNFLDWGAVEREKYEDSRRAYAALIGKYGEQDVLLFRMLRYFIRMDKIDEVERLRLYYEQRPNIKVDAEAYAEMGGYLTDKSTPRGSSYLDSVPSVLFRALKVRPDLPEIHYNLARYYRIVKDAGEERKALSSGVLPLLKGSDVLTRARMTMEIDTHTRLGELDYREKSYLDAEKEYDRAIHLVESYQSEGLIRAERIFGQPYVDRGDLQYYIQGDLRGALANYAKAEANGYTEPVLDYKTGYIHYVGEELDAALDRFLKAEDALASPRPPANLLFAVANAFYQKGDYFAAQGYYLRLLDWLTTRKTAIGTLQPEQQPEHRALLEGLVKTENNLGVVMIRLAERTGDRRRKSQALVSLTSASETADVLSRVPETLVRSEAKNLPFLNMRGVLYPLSGFELQIYRVIPKDFETLFY